MDVEWQPPFEKLAYINARQSASRDFLVACSDHDVSPFDRSNSLFYPTGAVTCNNRSCVLELDIRTLSMLSDEITRSGQ